MTIVILTHGGLAAELLAAAEIISGPQQGLEALCLDWNDSIDEAAEKVRRVLERLDQGDGVLILTDMFGGTPSNVAARFQQAGRVEVLSGVNLPMVLRLACRIGSASEPLTVGELAGWLQEKGRQSVRRVEAPAAAAVEVSPTDGRHG